MTINIFIVNSAQEAFSFEKLHPTKKRKGRDEVRNFIADKFLTIFLLQDVFFICCIIFLYSSSSPRSTATIRMDMKKNVKSENLLTCIHPFFISQLYQKKLFSDLKNLFQLEKKFS